MGTCNVSTGIDCNTSEEMCPIFVGDTIPFIFTFTQDDGTPLQTGGMELEFTMKLNEDDANDDPNTLYKKVVFPPPVEPATGIENMTLTSEDTSILISGRKYYYKFKLTNPMEGVPDEVFTLGYGQILVK